MNHTARWKLVLLLGLCPFAAPVVSGLYHMTIERWTLPDWLVLYSFIYWPTYLVGAALVGLALYKLRR